MSKTTIHFPFAAAITFVLAGPGAPASAIAQGGTEEAAKFAKSVDSTAKSIETTRAQLEKTLAGYNSIIDQTAKDTKDAYKDLGKSITESEKKVAETKAKVDEMNAAAESHFSAWKTNRPRSRIPPCARRARSGWSTPRLSTRRSMPGAGMPASTSIPS